MTTLILGDRVLDFGLGDLDTLATHIYVCRARPTTYLEAITSPATSPDNGYALGSKSFGAGAVFGSPFTSSPDIGRDITSLAVTGGSITASGTVLYWAVVDSVNTRLLATGPLTATGSPAGGDVTSGQTFTLDAFTIRMPSAAAAISTLKTGLISYWEFEQAGTPYTDSHTTGNSLTDQAGVTIPGSGMYGTAVQTTNGSEYVSHADSAGLKASGTDWSYAGWMFPTVAMPGLGYLGSKDGVSGREWFCFCLADGTFGTQVDPGGAAQDVRTSSGVLNNSAWNFFCLTFKIGGSVNLYVNSATALVTTAQSAVVPTGTQEFAVGGDFGGGGLTAKFDLVGWWQKELSPTEVAQLYAGGVGLPYSGM